MNLQGGRAGAPTLGHPGRQPLADLGRQVAKQISARPMYPDVGRLLVRRIGDQVERITSLECFQMAIAIGEGDAVDRCAKVRGPTIGERRTKAAHWGWDV